MLCGGAAGERGGPSAHEGRGRHRGGARLTGAMTARFCIRCGGTLRMVTEDGHRRPRCPRCGWTFYSNPVPAAVAIIVRRGHVLLGRRARAPYQGTWDLPGGFLEPYETPEAGLDRELREELGVGVRASRFVGYAIDRYGKGGVAVLALV